MPVIALSIIATMALVVAQPPALSRRIMIAILGLQAIRALSTVMVQVPIQIHLNAGFDLAATDRLITTDFWLRKVPMHAEAVLVIRALWLVVRHP